LRTVVTAIILLLSIFPAQASYNFTIAAGYDTNPKKLQIAEASPYLDLTASAKHSFGSWENSFKKVQVYLNTMVYPALVDHNSTYGSFRFERRPREDFRQKLTVGGSFSQNNYLSWEGYCDSITLNCSWERKIPPFTPNFGVSYSKYTFKEPYAYLNQTMTRPFAGFSYARKPLNLSLEYQAGKVNYLRGDDSLSKPSLVLRLTGGRATAGWQLVGRKNFDGNEFWGNLWREVGDSYLDVTLGQQKRRGTSPSLQYDCLWTEASVWLPVDRRSWLTAELSLTNTDYVAASWEREGAAKLSWQRPVGDCTAKLSVKHSFRQGEGEYALSPSSGTGVELSIRR
jgi:hypothetical protein